MNPTLNKNTFTQFRGHSFHDVMTIDGAVNKTLILLLLVIAPAAFMWESVSSGTVLPYELIMGGSLIGGLIFAFITIFKKELSPITAPIYSLFQGVMLGTISVLLEAVYPGIVIQAIGLTFGTLFAMLFLYKSKVIKVTENFRMGVFAATGAVALIYFFSFIMRFFGRSFPFIHESGTYGIIFSLIVVGIAALNLVLDFDFIEKGAHNKAPKYMEWYAAFGLMVTLIWLYLEILRLLSKMRSRR